MVGKNTTLGKSIVIFYSLEGHTKLIAELIAESIGATLLELKTEKEMPKTGFQKYFWGGKSVIFKAKPKLVNEIPDLAAYDTVFLGTPIWASTYTPPIYTFLSEHKIENKNVGFFACHAGAGTKKCFERFNKELGHNTILGQIDFVDPKSKDKAALKQQIEQWLKAK